jgi:hypothetical protein
MQSRLDGYRQSAAAVFLGVLAATLALDAAFFRSVLDPNLLNSQSDKVRTIVSVCLIVTGILLTIICISGSIIIQHIGGYFAEMTSVVYKIDEANRAWDTDVWLIGKSLYPHSFRSTEMVGRVPGDEDLVGWRDPMIRRLRRFTPFFALFHIILYTALVLVYQSPK